LTRKAIVTFEMVSADDIDPKDIRCPRCKGNTLILKGNHQIAREEVLQDGVVVQAKTLSDVHRFEIETIECHMCSVQFEVKPGELFELHKLNMLLREHVIDLGGKDPFGAGGIS
jgi:hypothetical protein